MVRTPCCEKMGLKKGPWTPEEDQILISYIQRYGHGNWRALPKQAGLLRCGKSCRLRWTNYLRPDIKRGNFSREEEETIIKLHELMGNRWSAIAARLPGRTDNEIKNVWHTHLKKRLSQNQATPEARQCSMERPHTNLYKERELKPSNFTTNQRYDNSTQIPVSPPAQSSSDLPSSALSSENGNMIVKDTEVIDIDDNLWSEALSVEKPPMADDFFSASMDPPLQVQYQISQDSFGQSDCPYSEDSMDFWVKLLIQAGDNEPVLPEF